ncbi:hypothetical protein EDB87DRAFT_1573574 [Lactarius vividus]|nr:hypothetical protein EDB87DRAFT_1573574 [Lactarius vividus]
MAGSLAIRMDVYVRGFPSSELGQLSKYAPVTLSEERPVPSTIYRVAKVGNRCMSAIGKSATYQTTKTAAFSFRWKDLERYSGVQTPSREWSGNSRTTLEVTHQTSGHGRVSWNGSRPVVEVFEQSLGNQKVTGTSGIPGRLDMAHSGGLTSAYGNMARDSFRELQIPRKLRSYECSYEEGRLTNEAAARKNPFKISMTSSAAILLLVVAQEYQEQGIYLSLGETRTRRQREVVIASHVKFVIKLLSVTRTTHHMLTCTFTLLHVCAKFGCYDNP